MGSERCVVEQLKFAIASEKINLRPGSSGMYHVLTCNIHNDFDLQIGIYKAKLFWDDPWHRDSCMLLYDRHRGIEEVIRLTKEDRQFFYPYFKNSAYQREEVLKTFLVG